MKKLNVLAIGLLISMSSPVAFAGQSHSEHKGNAGKYNNANACKEAKIGKFKPAALSEVAPGSEFSFMVFDANNPKQIEVTVKKAVIPVSVEDKGEMLVVHGKLPDNLKATAARINVKVKAKNPKCNSEEGWLLKITG